MQDILNKNYKWENEKYSNLVKKTREILKYYKVYCKGAEC